MFGCVDNAVVSKLRAVPGMGSNPIVDILLSL